MRVGCAALLPFFVFQLGGIRAQLPEVDGPLQTQYAGQFAEIRVGTGALASPGKAYVIHYTFWLPDGKKIASTYDRGGPFRFEQGQRRVMPGLEAGIEGMRAGGKRRLFIPYQFAAGEKGQGNIPPKTNLVCDVDLLEVRDATVLRKAAASTGARYDGISAGRPTGSSAISPGSLVAAYDMQSTTANGSLRDYGEKANHGVISGTEIIRGLFGDARRFAAATDRIALPSSASFAIDGPLSIAVWVRLNRGGLHQHVFACDDKFALWFTEDNKLRFIDTTGHGFQSYDALPSGQWHSIVGIYRGSKGDTLTPENLTVFLDGQELDGQRDPAWAPGPLHVKDACYIGFESHQGAGSHKNLGFAGDIDEVLIFARALSDSEVGAHATKRP